MTFPIHINAFLRNDVTNLQEGQTMLICTVIKEIAKRNEYVFKRDLNGDSDEAHLISFGMEFQTEEEAEENERSPSAALLHAVILRSGMLHEM